MNRRLHFFAAATICNALAFASFDAPAAPAALRTGIAGHAFDHTGTITDQAETVVASGDNIIYTSGVGVFGYQGQPTPEIAAQKKLEAQNYIRDAKNRGVRLAIGYVCATSIVNLESFDKNWTPEFRTRFRTPPLSWRQQDRNGEYLPSWYGGAYQPACMNNPDWREYERFMVREQLECGCDGIFFDNPTVHEHGCYCPACMKAFAQFLRVEGRPLPPNSPDSPSALRDWAGKHPADFMEFRGTIAREFIAEMRRYAHSIRTDALITANNSLNSPGVFFSQCRSFAYNIYEMSRAQDFIVIEDMSTQPRVVNGQIIEYTPMYHLLHAIDHGRPVVTVTVADADYTTAPNLMRLAAAEAAANDASYLSWPTWPESQRARMSAQFRPELDLLRNNSALFQDARARADVMLFLPYRQWLVTDQCRASQLSSELARANVSYEVICEDDLHNGPTPSRLVDSKILLAESAAIFTPDELQNVAKFKQNGGSVLTAEKADWLSSLQTAIGKPSIVLHAPPTVRAIVRDQGNKTIVHLLNLNVQKINSFEDKVSPASDIRITVRVPFKKVNSVRALTADTSGSSGALKFTATTHGAESSVEVTIPLLEVSSILVID